MLSNHLMLIPSKVSGLVPLDIFPGLLLISL
jgi:hypothetical protein